MASARHRAIRLFLSYNAADAAWARWIDWQLRRAGYLVAHQKWDDKPRQAFVRLSHEAASQAALTVALLSPDYRRRELTHGEWVDLFQQDLAGPRRKVLPICVRACTVPESLRGLDIVDIATRSEPAAARAIMQGLVRTGAIPLAGSAEPLREGDQIPFDEAQDSIDWSGIPLVDRPTYPGYMSEWQLPLDRPEAFVGREALVRRLRRALRMGLPTVLRPAKGAVDGVGKTWLALEYANHYRDRYSVVWWLRAHNPITLLEDFAALAEPILGVDVDPTATPARFETAMHWLNDHPHWLLIFDNAPSPEAIHRFLPDSIEGHVLVTSRHREWAGTGRPVNVGPMSRDEAIAMVEGTLSGSSGGAAARDAELLVNDLELRPDALTCVAGFMKTQGATPREALNALDAIRVETDDVLSPLETAVRLAMEQMTAMSSPTGDLLKLAAFVDADLLPTWVLAEGGEVLPRRLARVVDDPIGFARISRIGARFGLVTASHDMLTVQRAAQAALRRTMDDATQAEWATRALALMSGAFPWDPTRPKLWPTCVELLPHVSAVVRHAERLGIEPDRRTELLERCQTYLSLREQAIGEKLGSGVSELGA